jgi:hypothetical protein
MPHFYREQAARQSANPGSSKVTKNPRLLAKRMRFRIAHPWQDL